MSAIDTDASVRMEVLSDSPRVVLHHNAITVDTAFAIISAALPGLTPALLSGEAGGLVDRARYAESTWLTHDLNGATRRVVGVVSSIAGISAQRAEKLHVVRYREGGEYRAHFDSYDLKTTRGQRCTLTRGQRMLSALLYLNDGFSGGETAFPKLALTVFPRAGSVLIFDNCLDDRVTPHPGSLHCGQPVLAGEKWLATLWFRER
ncbi:2OG-Fe(II) oxygenase [Paraburkholderia sp. CNPSo 3076]|uniref:prolyl hydroxylase family protein n=1 Tax=Paraburkholderia sp. CNPSo 3076 TaxID=2940936 RepID=UPI00225B8FAE|nr:2OG-Fe(II) oxygenase [Paraburkholderia sp. CNPSo 3076]MCX5538092.1 2OG-Fe(II) oxygenase [Paraburkholderia sp. CNPSo 3076]